MNVKAFRERKRIMHAINENTTTISGQHFTGERALFKERDLKISGCLFDDGESPLKESNNIDVTNTVFGWRYPLWYAKHVRVTSSTFLDGVRAGLWYSRDVEIKDTVYAGPKGIRKCKGVRLENVQFPNGEETLWWNEDVELENVTITGDYLLQGSKNIHIKNLNLTGKYSFDGCSNVVVEDSRLITKDAFWNSENVVVRNCFIVSEYLAWNAKNITFENCIIQSLQGLCYVDGLTMRKCTMIDCDLAFEYCTDIDAEIVSSIVSIKNPISGTITAPEIGEIIFDDEDVDRSKTTIITAKECPCLRVVA